MANIDIQVPDIGDFDEVAVIELLVKVGDTVAVDQSLITVESDKASMEIPSSHAGVVTALKVKLGDKVKQGSLVLTMEAASASGLAVTNSVIATAAPSGLAVTEAKQSNDGSKQPQTASAFGLAMTKWPRNDEVASQCRSRL